VCYAERIFRLQNPKVGIISNGEEADKGSMLIRETYPLLQASGLNFVGNVEGKDLGRGSPRCDRWVTATWSPSQRNRHWQDAEDEFTAVHERRPLLLAPPTLAIPGLLVLSLTIRRQSRVDWREIGGAPLLGVNGRRTAMAEATKAINT
jgi:glycerol-3-phosphate acyltransferase PlsX